MIAQSSSSAQDCTLAKWYGEIKHGQIKLPRFQRYEAWDKKRITSFLNTVLHNLPVGVALVLEVDGSKNEPFVSRYISHAEPESPAQVTKHLLDGQQRLTAMWRAMNDNYDKEHLTFFVHAAELLEGENEEEGDGISCISQVRWYNKDRLFPLWVDKPASCLERGLIPMRLFRPESIDAEMDDWITEALAPHVVEMPDFHLVAPEQTSEQIAQYQEEVMQYQEKQAYYTTRKEQLKSLIIKLRERVNHFNLPYLILPSSTSKAVALQVFINMNTNSKPLSLYDVIVAEIESISGKSLHEKQQELLRDTPDLGHYDDVGDLILATAALLQHKTPNQQGMVDMCKQTLVEKDWQRLVKGLRAMSTFLAKEGIYDRQRLPTNAVLAVIAACFADTPEAGDKHGQVNTFLTKYMWRSFFTDRYENSTASRAFADFKVFSSVLKAETFDFTTISEAPVFKAELVDINQLIEAGWPKKSGTLARGILAVTTHLGALDFADQQAASFASIQNRHYHHIFPDALLKDASLKDESFKALNCALISGKTNLSIGRKDPLTYLKERVNYIDESLVEYRLKTHLINYHTLKKAQYDGLEGEDLKQRVKADYDAFLLERASYIQEAVKQLTNQGVVTVDSVFTQAKLDLEVICD